MMGIIGVLMRDSINRDLSRISHGPLGPCRWGYRDVLGVFDYAVQIITFFRYRWLEKVLHPLRSQRPCNFFGIE